MFAGVRSAAAAADLAACHPAITPLTLDVQRPDTIQQSRAAVETALAAAGSSGLSGLINNAGPYTAFF